jgi:hypothetical protein
MPRFLIEVPHDEDAKACTKAVKVLLETGSHFLTHADWGCKDGVHKAILIVEVDTKEAARSIVPPAFRAETKVTRLNGFSLDANGRINAEPS